MITTYHATLTTTSTPGHGGPIGRWSAVTTNLTPPGPGTTADRELMAAARMMLQRMGVDYSATGTGTR